MISPDWKSISENVSKYVNNNEFIRCRSPDDVCAILNNITLSTSQFNTFFSNLASFHDTTTLLNMISHANVEFTDNLSESLNNLSTLSCIFRIPFLNKLRDTINKTFERTHSDNLLREIQSLKESQQQKIEENKNIIINEINKSKESQQQKNEENKNIITTQSRNVDNIYSIVSSMSNLVDSYIVRKNYEDLSKLHKSSENFDKIYSIFEKMSKENDFVSAKLAVKAGYHKVTDKYSYYTIVSKAGDINNFELVKLLVDCGVDPSENGEGFYNALIEFCRNNNFTAVRYFCELPWVNRNAPRKDKWSLLHSASCLCYYDICKYLLTKSDVDVNMRDKDGRTPLSVAKSDRVRNLLKSHGAVL